MVRSPTKSHNKGATTPENAVLGVPSVTQMSRTSRSMNSSYVSPYSQKAMLRPIALVPVDDATSKRRQAARKKAARPKPVKPSVEELLQQLQRSSSASVVSESLSVGQSRLHQMLSSSNNNNKRLPTLPRTYLGSSTFISAGGGGDDDASHDGSEASLSTLGSLGGSVNTLASIGSFGTQHTLYSKTSIGTRNTAASRARVSAPSMRFMVADIENCIKNRLSPPEYVPRLCDLPMSELSWSVHRAARAARKQAAHLLAMGANPKIDIIGMHQSPGLILAKAVDRSTKLQQALSLKQGFIDEQRRQLIASIHNKMTRAERYAEALKVRQLQASWLKVLVLVRFNCTLASRFEENVAEYRAKKKERSAAFTLMRCLSALVVRKLNARFKNEFMKKAGKSLWMMILGLKVYRKKMAVKRIVDFLRSFKGNYRVKTVVHRFVASAHLIQKIGRSFILINRERRNTMIKIWDSCEIKHIIKKLEERQRLEQSAVSSSKGNLGLVQIDTKMRIEMEKQADKWRALDARMEKDLQRHRLSGILPNADSLRERAVTMMLALDVKRKCVETYIQMRRRAFVLLRDETISLRRKQAESFSKQDAHDLLSGDMAKIDSTIRYKYKVSFSLVEDSNPFMLFSGIDRNMLLQIVERVHDAAGTFQIKLRGARKTTMQVQPGMRKASAGVSLSLSAPALSMSQIHPSILAARKLKEEQDKKREKERMDRAIDDAVRSCMSGQLAHRKLVLREDQKRRRGGVQLDSVLHNSPVVP